MTRNLWLCRVMMAHSRRTGECWWHEGASINMSNADFLCAFLGCPR